MQLHTPSPAPPSTPIRGAAVLTEDDLSPFSWDLFNRIDPRDVSGDDSYDPFVVAEDIFLRNPVDVELENPFKQKGYAAYVVFNGRLMGVFQQWSAASWQVAKYSCCIYKGYCTLEQARNAWDHALVAGTWGQPGQRCEQQSLAPFTGYIVGGLDDPVGNQYREQGLRVAKYLACNPQAKRPFPCIVKADPQSPMATQRQCPPTPYKPKSPATPLKVLYVDPCLLGNPLAAPTPHTPTTPTPRSATPSASSRAVPAVPRMPIRDPNSRARTGHLAQYPLALTTDGPPPVPLTSDDIFYVVVVGLAPGIYLGRRNAISAAGSSEQAHIVKCFNEHSAQRLYAKMHRDSRLRILDE